MGYPLTRSVEYPSLPLPTFNTHLPQLDGIPAGACAYLRHGNDPGRLTLLVRTDGGYWMPLGDCHAMQESITTTAPAPTSWFNGVFEPTLNDCAFAVLALLWVWFLQAWWRGVR